MYTVENSYLADAQVAGEEEDRERCGFAKLFWVFMIGAFLGDVVETVFCRITAGEWMSRSSLVWGDYSDMHFQLGGRINLLFCLFWGVAAVVWVRKLYPALSHLVELILKKTGRVLTGILMAFITVDICVSVLALARYDARTHGKEAVQQWEWVMDRHFDDDRMQEIYPNGIQPCSYSQCP